MEIHWKCAKQEARSQFESSDIRYCQFEHSIRQQFDQLTFRRSFGLGKLVMQQIV